MTKYYIESVKSNNGWELYAENDVHAVYLATMTCNNKEDSLLIIYKDGIADGELTIVFDPSDRVKKANNRLNG